MKRREIIAVVWFPSGFVTKPNDFGIGAPSLVIYSSASPIGT